MEKVFEDAKRVYDIENINWKKWAPSIEFAETSEIYIRVFDEKIVLIPVKSKQLDDNQYLILNNNEFDANDYSILPQFIPEDIVSVEENRLENGEIKNVAARLIQSSNHEDKRFFEFLFVAALADIAVNKNTFEKYRNEILRVKDEYVNGRYFYPEIIETIGKFDKIVA